MKEERGGGGILEDNLCSAIKLYTQVISTLTHDVEEKQHLCNTFIIPQQACQEEEKEVEVEWRCNRGEIM